MRIKAHRKIIKSSQRFWAPVQTAAGENPLRRNTTMTSSFNHIYGSNIRQTFPDSRIRAELN